MGIIKTEGLAYEYARRDEDNNVVDVIRAVDGVTVDVERGSFLAILGRNGSGKSTLAKHINALLFPVEGTIWVEEIDTRDENRLLDVRQAAGMVFQNPDNQIIASVVEEDVGFGPENMGVPTEEIWRRVEECLDAVGMAAYRRSSPDMLSGGQKQRVAIAGVMAMRPKCIVLDEPTAMLDPNGRRDVIRIAHELNRREGITIILITHYMEETVDADRILVMDNGRVTMDGTPREIFARVEELKALHLDVPQVTELAHRLAARGLPLPEVVLTIPEFVEAMAAVPHKAARSMASDSEGDAAEADSPASSDASSDDILELRSISYIYNPGTPMERRVLDDISMKIGREDFVAIIGHTGSGKSTLIQHMDGLLKATSGDILFHGSSIYAEGFDMKTLRSKVVLVFQYPEHQLFEADVLSDVCFGPRNLGLDRAQAEERAREALAMVGVKEKYFSRSPFELSGGQKRRVAIAGALAMRPEILVLDEPTAGLDPGGRDDILDTVAALHEEQGMAVVLVSHSMEDVATYADRLVVVSDGVLMFDDIPRNVFKHTKELEEIGLSAPQVTYINSALADAGWQVPKVVTTIDEAEDAILRVAGLAEAGGGKAAVKGFAAEAAKSVKAAARYAVREAEKAEAADVRGD